MQVAVMRAVVIFVISFLAYKFLDIIFDSARSYLKEKNKPKDNLNKSDVIETEFVEDGDKNDTDNGNKDA